MSGSNGPRNQTGSRFLTRHRGNRRSVSPPGRVISRTRTNRVIMPPNAGTLTQRNAFIPSSRVANEHEECVVCRDEPAFFPRDTPSPACRHRTEVCFDCLKGTIKEAVKAGRFDDDGTRVRCPSTGCNEWMNPSDIMTWADVETFVTWVKLFSKAVIMDR